MTKIDVTLLTTIILLFVTNSRAFAQDAYEFSVEQSNYSELTGGTSVNGTATWDDLDGAYIPLGFKFKMFDTPTDTFQLFGYAQLVANDHERFIAGFFALGLNLIDRGWNVNVDSAETTGSLSPISYQTTGSPGNRICKIEWRNAGFYSEMYEDSISEDFVNFQAWLYETSNNIEIHFGPSNILHPEQSYDGFPGPWITLYPSYDQGLQEDTEKFYILSGDSSKPDMIHTFSYDYDITGMPTDGTVYKFTYIDKSVSNKLISNHKPLRLHPNPTSAEASWFLSSEVQSIALKNMAGQSVNFQRVNSNTIDLGDLKPGVYMVEILTQEGYTLTEKLIKD
jgi:hypothetical protein